MDLHVRHLKEHAGDFTQLCKILENGSEIGPRREIVLGFFHIFVYNDLGVGGKLAH